jgi:hypothetical protein
VNSIFPRKNKLIFLDKMKIPWKNGVSKLVLSFFRKITFQIFRSQINIKAEGKKRKERKAETRVTIRFETDSTVGGKCNIVA